MLGPFLARQIATIYGQMADYSGNKEDLPYKGSEILNRTALTKTLERLCNYTDVALEGLAFVEMTGDVYHPAYSEDYDDDDRQLPPGPSNRKIKLPSRARSLPKPDMKTDSKKPAAPEKATAKAPEAPKAKKAVTPSDGEITSAAMQPRQSVKPNRNRTAARAALEALESNSVVTDWPAPGEDMDELKKAIV
jgi:hypothetical protein